jgi:sugar phosphate isomerase/epimerase
VDIGIALWNLEGEEYKEKVNRVVELGFTAISFLGSSFEKEKAEQIGGIIRNNNLRISFHLSFFGLNKEKLIENLDIRLESINKFLDEQKIKKNAWSICYDPAFNGSKNSNVMEFDMENTARALKFTLDKYQDIKVGVENWTINSKISQLKELKEKVGNERLGMLLDIGHMHIAFKKRLFEEKNIDEYLKALPFQIYEFHIHDNDGDSDLHLPLGRGNMDYEAVLGGIIKNCRFCKKSILTLEIIPHLKQINMNDEDKMKEIKKTKNILESRFK